MSKKQKNLIIKIRKIRPLERFDALRAVEKEKQLDLVMQNKEVMKLKNIDYESKTEAEIIKMI